MIYLQSVTAGNGKFLYTLIFKLCTPLVNVCVNDVLFTAVSSVQQALSLWQNVTVTSSDVSGTEKK